MKQQVVDEDVVVVGEFRKNAAEVVRASLTQYMGRQLIDVRVYVEERPGEFSKPTRKGLTIRREQIPDLRVLLEEAERMAARA